MGYFAHQKNNDKTEGSWPIISLHTLSEQSTNIIVVVYSQPLLFKQIQGDGVVDNKEAQFPTWLMRSCTLHTNKIMSLTKVSTGDFFFTKAKHISQNLTIRLRGGKTFETSLNIAYSI